MKHLSLTSVTLIALMMGATHADAYTYNGLIWEAQHLPLTIDLHNAGASDITVEDLEGIVQTSLDTWNDVACSSIALEYGGLTEETLVVDDTQVLQWVSDEDAWVYGSMAAGATIIMGFDDPNTPERDRPKVDIGFNAVNFRWIVGGAGVTRLDIVDPESVLTHELGHLLGISHTQRGLDNVATMAAAYVPDLSQRTLAPDDKQAICELYWQEGSECDTDGDCRDRETCENYLSEDNDATVRLCYEVRGTFGDFCNADDLNCQGLCLFQTSDLQEGFCSAQCQTDDECPDGWGCRNIMTVNNPLFVCRELEEQENNDAPDAGNNDAPDAGNNDAPDAGNNDAPDADSDDATQDDDPEKGGEGGEGGGGDKGCATSPSGPTSAWTALLVLGLALFQMRRRRRTSPQRTRRGSSVFLCAVAAAMAFNALPSDVSAQSDMTFEATEPTLRTHVFILEANRVPRRDVQTIKTVIEDRVAQNSAYELLRDPDMQREARRSWGQLRRCKDRECVFDNVIDASLDRVIFVRVSRDSGLLVDMEIDDAYERALIKYTMAPAESARDAYVIEAAIDELLTPDLPPAPPAQSPATVAPTVIPDRPLGPPPAGAPAIDSELDSELTAVGASPSAPSDGFALDPMVLYTIYGGGGLLALGGVFALLADNTQAEIQARPHDRATVEELIQSGQRFKTGANTMYGLGAATLVTSAVLFFVLEPPDAANSASAGDDLSTPTDHSARRFELGLSPTGATIRLSY